MKRSAFTLIELLVVIAIIAILAVVVVLTLNPAQLLAQSRDANRVSDMATLNSAIGLYQTDFGGKGSMGSSSVVYVSLPDASISGNATSACSPLGLPGLPTGYLYQCASPQGIRDTDGTGWIPANFQQISSGAPFGSLPVDPTNNSSSRLFYTYNVSGTQYEVTASMESAKYKLGGSNDVLSTDGGTLASVYEKGTKLGLEPLDFGDPSLVALWTMDEGTGGWAYDTSGNRATGTWAGTQAGTNSTYYAPGKVGNWAGYFDGSTNFITIPDSASLHLPTVSTIMVWFKVTAPSSLSYATILTKGSSNVGGYYDYRLITTASGTMLYDGITNPGEIYSPATITLGTWYLAAAVADGAGISLYVNGAKISYQSGPGPYNTSGNPLYIGGGVGQKFNGLIDDIRIYNRALSAVEIQALYNAGK